MNTLYNIYIYERYKSLKESEKEIDNYDLSKIFEYFTCIKLTEEYGKQFYEYDDIHPEFKEENNMSRSDTGIDCCDIIDTIVQCKLRKDILNWKDCSTFFGSQNIFCPIEKKAIVRWPNLIISRNVESKLSDNLLVRTSLFNDKTYSKMFFLDYCENLLVTPPEYPKEVSEEFLLRDYQEEAIKIIIENPNVIISLPTGCGKNVVVINSFVKGKKYLILVPRIILMDQLKDEIIKHKPFLKNKIQLIGDNNNKFDHKKEITICVFNSVAIVEPYAGTFEKIFVDEAHHIYKPEIYEDDESIKIPEKVVEELNEEEDSDIDELEEELEEEYQEEIDDEYSEDDERMLEDDEEDELKETTNYNHIIRDFKKYNNNVYLSATIDEENGFVYYKKEIREMIEKGYLCDYTIHVPVFTDDPTNKNICEYLIKNYRNMIIYCNSQKEGKKIVDLMNNLQTGIAEYIDCKTGKRKRNDIIRKFKEGKVPYLVNVRILVEGFDAPITKGVIFLHLPRSQTTLVQIIGRALRLHKMKKIANIILPFSSKEDEKNIGNFLRVMARNDSRIRKAFNNKKVGGYICIDRDEKEDDEEEQDIELKYEMIYSSLGGLKNGEEIWMQKLEEVKRYISNFRKKPTHSSRDDKIRRMGVWIDGQKYNYDKDIKKCRYSMKNPVIHSTWKKILEDKDFSFYLYNSKEKWKYYYNKVIDFININNKNPSIKSKNNDEIIISRWLSNQKRSFDIDYSKCRYIMKDIELYNLWKETCENNNYSIYFKNNIIENWKINYYKLISYIDNNHKSPSQNERDKDIKSLGIWTSAQRSCYDTNISKSKKLFKNKKIHNLWSILYNNLNYSKYIYNYNILIWKNNFELVKIFIDKYNITPSTHSKKFDEKRLGHWILDQRKKYHIDMNLCSGVMNNEEINLIWRNILIDEKYGYFFSPKK